MSDSLDRLDIQLLDLLISGNTTRQIATEVARPLSTVQRRIKRLVKSGFVTPTFEVDYSKLGLKRGMLHICMSEGDTYALARRVAAMSGIISVSVQIGNSDVIAEYVGSDGEKLLEMLSQIKKLSSVSKVVWSEQVTSIRTKMPIISMLSPEFD